MANERIIYFSDRYLFNEVLGLGAFGVVISAYDKKAVHPERILECEEMKRRRQMKNLEEDE